MNRQQLLLEIRNLIKGNKDLANLIISKEFIKYPEYKYLKEAFNTYKKNYKTNEQWDQFARFALKDPKETTYMCERTIQLLIKYCLSYNTYFKIRSEHATSPFFDRISSLNRLLILHKEYFQIYLNIIKKIHFDYPTKDYSEKLIKGVINWTKTFQKSQSNFPLEFKTHRFFKQFTVPENILLILAAFWLEKEATRLLRIEFLEPLDINEISILNTIAQSSKKIITLFPLRDVLDKTREFFNFSINDSRIRELETLSRYRLDAGIIKNNEYFRLLKWIYKFRELNIRMFSSNKINFPIDNISSLDALYEVWIFFEILDFINSNYNNTNILFRPGKINDKNEKEIPFFDFKFKDKNNNLIRFYFGKSFTFDDKSIWVGPNITPDFTVMTGDEIIAVFDAKNYTKDRQQEARNIMLAYMTNLDTNYGALFFPKDDHIEYNHPRPGKKGKYHSDLKLALYKLEPVNEEIAINNNHHMIDMILKEIKDRVK